MKILLKDYIDKSIKIIIEKTDIPEYKNIKLFLNRFIKIKINKRNKNIVFESEIYDIDTFVKHYEVLFTKKMDWININCTGIKDKDLIFSIEIAPGILSENIKFDLKPVFSGPPIDHQSRKIIWDFEENYMVLQFLFDVLRSYKNKYVIYFKDITKSLF